MPLTPAQQLGAGVIGLQGEPETGKSTIGRDLAHQFGCKFYETSDYFRGFTAWLHIQSIQADQSERVLRAAARGLEFSSSGGVVLFDGLNVTSRLRTARTDAEVAVVAHYPEVRAAYREAMTTWIAERPAIVAGRNLAEIFPELEMLLEIRRPGGVNGHQAIDAAREARRLQEAETRRRLFEAGDGAIVVETTGLGRREQFEAVLLVIERQRGAADVTAALG